MNDWNLGGWSHWANQALATPAHQKLHVPKYAVERPEHAGFYQSVGMNLEAAHFRKPLDDNRGLHVEEHSTHYTLHWDHKEPSRDLIGHLVEDAPIVLLGLGLLGLWWLNRR